MEEAGEKLKKIRQKLKLSFRDVEEASTRLSIRYGSEEYVVALSRLSDIENKGVTPSIYRLYSLCAIYRLDFSELLAWYKVDLAALPSDSDVIALRQTHVVGFHRDSGGEIQVPFALDPGIDLTKTTFLSRMIQKWGTLPLMLLHNQELKSYRYGLIGTDDDSMYPMIPPGSLVVIDDNQTSIAAAGWNTIEERPIYFLETRDAYLCGWCALRGDQLTVQFHPAGPHESRTFKHPDEIEVIGRVIRVAKSLDDQARPRSAGA
jgi:transcriptional regulator with XRE-family HTH domain